MNAEWLLKTTGFVQHPRSDESDLEAEDGYNDSLRGKGRDHQEAKLKIKALSQDVGRYDSIRMPREMKDGMELGRIDAPDQLGLKKRRLAI
jgi:hypothetical protein